MKKQQPFLLTYTSFLVKEKILCTSDGDLTIEVKFRKIQIHDSEFLDVLAKHKYCIFTLNIFYIYMHT